MYKALIILMSLLITGCASLTGDDGVFRNRAKDYHGSKLVASLNIPKDLSEPMQNDMYPIDESFEQAPIQGIDLEPPEFDMGE